MKTQTFKDSKYVYDIYIYIYIIYTLYIIYTIYMSIYPDWEWIDEMSWLFACWYKFRKAKCHFNNYWVGMLKNGWNLLDHKTQKSGVSHKWFDESSGLINFCMLIVIE